MLTAESKEELKKPLDEGERVKKLSKTQHSKKIMVSGPITSWQINEKKKKRK